MIILTLVHKDLMIFFRNRFFALITILGVAIFVGVYLLLPNSVDAEMDLALYAPGEVPSEVVDAFKARLITIDVLDSQDALMDKVEDQDYAAGLLLPDDLMARLQAGESSQITLYLAANGTQEINDAVAVLVGMVMNDLNSRYNESAVDVRLAVKVLGFDFGGESLSVRKRMLPMLAVFMLVTETLGVASLFAEERARHTLRALLTTPVRYSELLISKGIMGVGLAFVQVMIIMAVAGTLQSHALLIICVTLLGSFMVTGIGFLLASIGKDMLSIMGWAVLSYVVLSVPSFSIMFPGASADWLKAIPSYYMVDTVHRVVNYNAGWGDVGTNLVTLLVYSVVIMGVSVVTLRRRLA